MNTCSSVPLDRKDLAQLQAVTQKKSDGSLNDYISAQGTHVSNADPSTTLKSVLDGMGELKSDSDEELLINIAFQGAVTLKGFRITCDESKADDDTSMPAEIKVFINSTSMDFDDAHDLAPKACFELSKEQLVNGAAVELSAAKFSNVNSVTLFIATNQAEAECTYLNNLVLLGTPKDGFNMNEIKKVG